LPLLNITQLIGNNTRQFKFDLLFCEGGCGSFKSILIPSTPNSGHSKKQFLYFVHLKKQRGINIHNVITGFFYTVTSSVRKFAAFLIVLVIIGMLIGARIEHVAASFLPTAIMIPVLLAIVAYAYTDAAIALLFGFMFLFLLL